MIPLLPFLLTPQRTPRRIEPDAPIVVFGDSYTSGTGAPPEATMPAHLQQILGRPVIGEGVHGETAREAWPRIPDVLAHDPALVVVAFGVNEAFRRQPIGKALDGLDGLMGPLSEAGIRVVVATVHFGTYQAGYDAAVAELAAHHGAGLVTGTLDGVLEDPRLRSDAHHPNGAGYRVMAARIAPEVRAWL